jgi:hypothetical protein
MNKMTKVFIAMHNPMIYESAFGIISVHAKRKGAEMAMEFDKANALKRFNELYKDIPSYSPFGTFEAWSVFEFEVND